MPWLFLLYSGDLDSDTVYCKLFAVPQLSNTRRADPCCNTVPSGCDDYLFLSGSCGWIWSFLPRSYTTNPFETN